MCGRYMCLIIRVTQYNAYKRNIVLSFFFYSNEMLYV